MVECEIIYKLQLRANKKQQQGHTPDDRQGWETVGSSHYCAYLIQLAQDHSKDGDELTDICARRGIFCPGADSS